MNIKASKYFMYGMIISYKEYEEQVVNPMKYSNMRIFLDEDEDIHGIFTGRDGNFIIIGKVLESMCDNNDDDVCKEPLIVPELESIDRLIIEKAIKDRYGFTGDFHYYFITKYK
jgi:hypothetical protein